MNFEPSFEANERENLCQSSLNKRSSCAGQ